MSSAPALPSSAPLPPPSPTARARRSLAPDVARGLVLLGIALANVPFWLYGVERGVLLKPIGSESDAVANAITALLFDNRSFPLFALLFAAGLAQITAREAARGASWPEARRLLVRRNLWLLAIGAAHGVLLFFGDIITTYAIIGLGLILLVRASDRVIIVVGWIGAAVLVIMSALDGVGRLVDDLVATGIPTGGTTGGDLPEFSLIPGAAGAESYPLAVLFNVLTWLPNALSTPIVGLGFLGPMSLGILAVRRGWLDRPDEHRALLTRAAAIGIPISLVGALPVVLAILGVYELPPLLEPLATMLHGASGLVGAAAGLALVALVAGGSTRSAGDRPPLVLRWLAALGRRSLTGYLLQSVVFMAVFSAWAAGLGDEVGAAVASFIALATWVATLVLAIVLDAADRPGPAEWVLRRLVYGRAIR
ncbi:MAG: DUF418 domain-containing protein [Actinomycetes bacterium]